ncbi:MAG TPA: hypothetical protein VLV31_13115 [Candidatus Acidoferrales bacterium]|nr:hypothetical protein [Candidatus Acidoferrales bacterium]
MALKQSINTNLESSPAISTISFSFNETTACTDNLGEMSATYSGNSHKPQTSIPIIPSGPKPTLKSTPPGKDILANSSTITTRQTPQTYIISPSTGARKSPRSTSFLSLMQF